MNFPGTGFITILLYGEGFGTLVPDTAILTEAGNPIFVEGGDYLITE